MVNAGRFIRGNFPAPGDGPDWINCPPLTSPAIPVLNGPKLERRRSLQRSPNSVWGCDACFSKRRAQSVFAPERRGAFATSPIRGDHCAALGAFLGPSNLVSSRYSALAVAEPSWDTDPDPISGAGNKAGGDCGPEITPGARSRNEVLTRRCSAPMSASLMALRERAAIKPSVRPPIWNGSYD